MRCEAIMKTNVECVSPTMTVQQAARKMREQNIGFLPVCDSSRRVLGTLTDRDIAVRLVAENRSASTPISTILNNEVIACSPEDDLSHARELMAEHHKSRLMCLDDDGRIRGVISLSDLAQLDAQIGAEVLRQVSEREARQRSALWQDNLSM